MKLEKSNVSLDADNLQSAKELLIKQKNPSQYQGLLCVIADVLDTAISGSNCYLIIGLTRDRNALLLTVHQDGAKAFAGGLRLTELSREAEKLLPPL